MTHVPTLSICVPSRNRQVYFQATIRALTASLRSDIELVFVDNSDDASVMDAFIQPYLADPRVKYVPSGATVRPMVDNWEVALQATTGRWISVIGDDDHIDPDVAGLLTRIEAEMPDVEALDWARLFFTWPYPGKPPYSNVVQLLTEIHEVPKDQLKERAFRWDHAREVLGCGFGIYHGAVSRVLMERIKSLSKTNRYFEHPIVDYDNIYKLIMHGKRFVHCRRPLSVMGACPLSNTAAVNDLKDAKKKLEAFHREHKNPIDDWECYRDFPFRAHHGVTACIGMTQHWFAKEYGYDFAGFEKNFARSCAIQCEGYPTREEFEVSSAAYREVFAKWQGGRFAKYFRPVWKDREAPQAFGGMLEGKLYLSDAYETAATPAEYYDMVGGILLPVENLVIDFENVRVVSGVAA
ncbi:glycosyltransferase family 2 protein [Rhizobium sp. LjRoot254]|uniref:glycosyltransferase family 2 protein n=1 Tax=Rhizobium sp. LjRoot254 TaxID=3342297 RepID=UPI003ECEB3CB